MSLNSENSGQPCFLVHPAGGNVLCYRALAQRLQRPVLGLQAAGLQGEQAPLATVEDMAALYLRAVRERQPHGPYLLGGWSSGGVIAFEMARQLEAQGERVEPLLLIDSPAPLQHGPVDGATLAAWFVQDLDIGFDPPAAGALRGPDPLAEALALAAAQGVAPNLDIDLLRPVHAVFNAVIQATRAYRPKDASLATGIGVLRAAEGSVAEFAGHPAAAQADWGWSAFTRGPARADRVGGTHHSMMKPVNADALLHAWAALWPCGGDEARRTGHGEASNA